MLWFAWKIVPLRYTKQQTTSLIAIELCCDLLEKSYLCGIQNNRGAQILHAYRVVICLKNRTFAVYKTTPQGQTYNVTEVVICLKNRTFAVYKTTRLPMYWCFDMLWFAWKIVPLRYTKQLALLPYRTGCGCDLLEKSYLCGIQNNQVLELIMRLHVVICLKNRTFAVYKTTNDCTVAVLHKLWFAWKIVPLRYTKQPAY